MRCRPRNGNRSVFDRILHSQTGLGLLLGLGLSVGCAGQPPDLGPDPDAEAALVAARPYQLDEPANYFAATPTPLVLLLHAYMTSGELQKIYFGFGPLADSEGFLLAYPDGTEDRAGKLFWNATDACCNLDKSSVDDVAYLRAVIHDAEKRYNIDRQRIFVVGHSNGAFMAHRLACDLSGEIAAIASLAGALFEDASRCQPTSPVAVLEIHGDRDDVVRYEGGDANPPLTAPYPSAHETVAQWAQHERCASLSDSGARLDLCSDVADAETKVERYSGCQGGAVELWTMQGGGHYPVVQPAFGASIWSFLSAHPKPQP